MSQPLDAIAKTLVETTPGDWPVLIGQKQAPTEVIDADIATISGAADKVVRVLDEPPYLIHLEFVSGHDAAQLPPLLHRRNTLLDTRHNLLVRSVVVLLGPKADSPQLTGKRIRRFPHEPPYHVFSYHVLRPWTLPPEIFLAGGIGTWPFAPISAVTRAQLPGIMERVGERINDPAQASHKHELWLATYMLLGLRYSPGLADELTKGMISMEESTTYQAILAKGEARGVAIGETRGKAQGALEEAKKMLRLFGEARLGPMNAKQAAALEAMDDLHRVEELTPRMQNVGSWRELLASAAPRRRTRRPNAE